MECEVKLAGVGIEVEVEGLRGIATLLGVGVLAAVVMRELRLPRETRTWHGRLCDCLPYDLRPPTLARLRASLWNPASSSVLTPTAFGVGWSVNLAALATCLGICTEACDWTASEDGPQPAV